MSDSPLRIAAICTCWSKNSHADVIIGKFLRGELPTDEGIKAPRSQVVSLYIDQVGPLDSATGNFAALDDLGVGFAEKYGARLCGSIAEALCLGGSEVAVDGVLAIGEHGDYPVNAKGQRLYPRRHFWEQISGVLATSANRSQIPIFTDKHLAVTWEDAEWIYRTGRELGLVHMAGSSVPHFQWRDPWLEHDADTPIEAALMLSYGDLEAYGYHGAEALLAMVENRPGGESGIASVRCLSGDALWEAAEQGDWPLDLAQTAFGVVNTNDASAADGVAAAVGAAAMGAVRAAAGDDAALFELRHTDGFRSWLLHGQGEGNLIGGWAYAARVTGQGVVATGYMDGDTPNYGHFSYLCAAIDQMFVTKQSPYPVERTLLVTGALDSLMESHATADAAWIETPQLAAIAYPAADTSELYMPKAPRASGATVEASSEFRADYEELFTKKWLGEDVGYPDAPSGAAVFVRRAAAVATDARL